MDWLNVDLLQGVCVQYMVLLSIVDVIGTSRATVLIAHHTLETNKLNTPEEILIKHTIEIFKFSFTTQIVYPTKENAPRSKGGIHALVPCGEVQRNNASVDVNTSLIDNTALKFRSCDIRTSSIIV